MSRTSPTEWQVIVMKVPCSHCGAEYGQWCRSANGSWASWLHGVRDNPVREAYAVGYLECEQYAQAAAARAKLSPAAVEEFLAR